MKKAVSVGMALTMALCFTALAWAGETGTPVQETKAEETTVEETTEEAETLPEAGEQVLDSEEIHWEDIAPDVEEAGLTGKFVSFDEVSLSFYLFDGFIELSLSDEEVSEGYIGYYQTADGAYQIAVMYVDGQGMTMEDYIGVIPDLGGEIMGIATINSLEVLLYTVAETDTLVASMLTENGYYAEITFYPISDESMNAFTSIMLCSIMEEA